MLNINKNLSIMRSVKQENSFFWVVCSLRAKSLSRPSWVKPWSAWSDLIVIPALSRRLDWGSFLHAPFCASSKQSHLTTLWPAEAPSKDDCLLNSWQVRWWLVQSIIFTQWMKNLYKLIRNTADLNMSVIHIWVQCQWVNAEREKQNIRCSFILLNPSNFTNKWNDLTRTIQRTLQEHETSS